MAVPLVVFGYKILQVCDDSMIHYFLSRKTLMSHQF